MGYNYKRIYIILGIFLLVSVFVGGTLGFYQWTTSSSQKTNVVFTVQDKFSCAADGGGNITSSDVVLAPTDCTNSDYAIKRELKVMPTLYDDLRIEMSLWLEVNDLGEGLSDSQNFRYALTTSDNSCVEGLVTEGNFNGKTVGDTITLLDSKSYSSTTTDTYYLYVWLDKEETSTSTMNQSFDLSLNGSCVEVEKSSIPVFEYTGLYEVVDDDDNKIEDIDNYVGDWKIRFLTSGTLTFNVLNDAAAGIDVFLVGGGGAGGAANGGYSNGASKYQGSGGGGGAGGYTTTMSNQKIFENIVYEITVGAGAASTGETGEESSAFGFTASGGGGGSSVASNLYTASGGLGGSNGGTGAFKKNNGSSPGFGGQPGQGTTTREFGEPTGKLYSGGGAGGRGHYGGSSSSTIVGGEGGGGASNTAGTANTGGGGGGGSYIGSSIAAGSGGSGIVIIRNHRVPDYTKNPNLPTFTYTGVYEVVNDDGDILGANDENWKIRFLTSGTLTITSFNNANNKIDVFLVGGGGAGGAGKGGYNNSAEKYEGSGGAGGGGGYTTTSLNQELTENISYNIVVGSGGLSSGATGGESSAFGITALGGSGGGSANGLAVTTDGGLGGSNGGTGAYMNITGSTPGSDGNFGQGITTREFGEPTGMLYAGGGAGGVGNHGTGASAFVSGGEGGGGSSNIDAIANTGGGGGGGSYVYSGSGLAGKSGGTGIVIIRNSRVEDYTKNPNLPIFTYTGVYEVVDDNGDSLGIDDENWKIRFLTSGTLTISSLNGASNGIDVFLVGGGGAGGASNGGYSNGASKYEGSGGGGGAGGYTTTSLNQEILENISYEIVVGAGGLSTGLSGGESSAFGFTASGGGGGSSASGIAVTSAGGTGGSNGGTGANMKTKGSTPGSDGTPGQDTTTREFGELSGILYAGGGAGGIGNYGGSASAFVSGGAGGGGSSNVAGVSNTGSGGGGGTCFYYGKTSGKPGGSGIVIIRNTRSS